MSTLGYFSSRLDRQQTKLELLTGAILILQAAVLGETVKLGVGDEAVATAKTTVSEFAQSLCNALKSGEADQDLQPILLRIRTVDGPDTDWIEDLNNLTARLGRGDLPTDDQITRLRRAVGYLRQQVAENSDRISSR
jgi:hypothetical protein